MTKLVELNCKGFIMIAGLYYLLTITCRFKNFIIPSIFFIILIFYPSGTSSVENKLSVNSTSDSSKTVGITYSNPRVYNVDYSFELFPDPAKIDRAKDLKLWLPIPREWDSQKAIKIISIHPSPHETFEDPEHGNQILFWDFGKGQAKETYEVKIKYRLEIFEIHCKIDPKQIYSYDMDSEVYRLNTRSTFKININQKVKELAQIAIGDENNTYLQAKRIFEFVRRKMRSKFVRLERGSGIDCLLDYPVIDEKTGEHYFEGTCGQYSVFFIALCRAIGIPARGVNGMTGWDPLIKEKDLKLRSEDLTKLTSEGLAAARIYGPLGGHSWCEIYLPTYGWIPVDPTWGEFGYQSNYKLILSKGRDVMIGPHAPQKESEGYGDTWIPLYKGRADIIGWGVWNLAKVHVAEVKVIHHSDPFPADGLAGYPTEYLEKDYKVWRKRKLSRPSYLAYSSNPKNFNLVQTYHDNPSLKQDMEPFVCQMLHRQMGDEGFFNLLNRYVEKRQKSKQPVSTSDFQNLAESIYGESLNWFFKQWVNIDELPCLKLENVAVKKDKTGWQIKGRLLQLSDTVFQLPIELAIDTKKGRKKQNLLIDKNSVDFDLHIQDKPQKLVVDPDYKILKLQKMPPRLWWFGSFHPNYMIIYGTLAESQANKLAAELLNEENIGLDRDIIIADTEVKQDDLNKKCVFLIGRPETNKITQQFKDIFPVKFDGSIFTWNGINYDQPTQGISQIVENPMDPKNLIILYAGLSGETTQKISNLYLYDIDASFIILEQDKQLVANDWEEYDRDLVWKFD
jgi:transglutaminase-like putative cysteine protease